jgi:hypothetical protein
MSSNKSKYHVFINNDDDQNPKKMPEKKLVDFGIDPTYGTYTTGTNMMPPQRMVVPKYYTTYVVFI